MVQKIMRCGRCGAMPVLVSHYGGDESMVTGLRLSCPVCCLNGPDHGFGGTWLHPDGDYIRSWSRVCKKELQRRIAAGREA